MGGFQNTLVGWQRQRSFQRQQLLRFFLVLLEAGEQEVYVRIFKPSPSPSVSAIFCVSAP
jgi:hypothetical protein